ncbi:MAG TPA: universal stress protein [Rugosimonospora sp.]|nr:universal stress protein [Rugosimonospora sp.]
MKDKPVLVGVDGSTNALAALTLGAWQARRRHVPLRLVHALTPVPQFGVAPTLPYVVEAQQSAGRAILAHAAEQVHRSDPDLPVSTAVTVGAPSRVLLQEAAAPAGR